MKLRHLDKVLLTWTILCSFYHPSDTLLVTGVRSLKTYMDHVIRPLLNISSDDHLGNASHVDSNLTQTLTLKEYLDSQPFTNEDIPTQKMQRRSSSNQNVVIMARIGEYDKKTANGGEWIEVSSDYWGNHDNETDSTSLSDFDQPAPKGQKDIEEYENSYQDFLYTFKDLVSIGLNPRVTDQIIEKGNSESLAATYIMSIPKTTKFFEFKVSNLTWEQYNELDNFIKMHLQKNKKNSTVNHRDDKGSDSKKDEKRQISSVDLNKSYGSLQLGSRSPSQFNSEGGGPWKNIPNEINIPLHQLFTENNYETFKNNIKKNMSSNNKNNRTKSLINNNGFHAEIATDYMHKNDDGQRSIMAPNFPNDSVRYSGSIDYRDVNGQFNNDWLSNINDTVITSLLMKIIEQHNLLKENQSKNSALPFEYGDAISNKSQDQLNASTWKTELESKSQPKLVENSAPLNNKFKSNSSVEEVISRTVNRSEPDDSKAKNSSFKLEDQGLNSSHVDLYTSPTGNNDTQKRSNIDMSFITDFFHNNASYLFGEEDDAKIMKINKQGNVLEELKMLMMEYFASLQLNTSKASNYSLLVQDILNSTNLFELMQRSSQFVKENLKLKVQKERKEPSTFVKKVIDTQVDRCKKRFSGTGNSLNKTMNIKMSRNSFKNNSRRRFINLTKCIASKVRECVIGFNNWLARGKFYLRPQFKLQRAYEHFEIEKNLFCLRKYNATYLDSNIHGIRIRPGSKMAKMNGRKGSKPVKRRYRFKKARKRNEGRMAQKGNIKQLGQMENKVLRNNQANKQMNSQRYPGNNRHIHRNQTQMYGSNMNSNLNLEN